MGMLTITNKFKGFRSSRKRRVSTAADILSSEKTP